MTWTEEASMTSGTDLSYIGLVTPGTIALATELGEGLGNFVEVFPRRRGDAAVFVTRLLKGGLQYVVGIGDADYDHAEDLMVAQAFAEATKYGAKVGFTASEVVAGTVAEELGSGSFHWALELNLDPVMIDSVLDELAQRGPEFSDIVTATRAPGSAAGLARRPAVDRWEQEHADWLRPQSIECRSTPRTPDVRQHRREPQAPLVSRDETG